LMRDRRGRAAIFAGHPLGTFPFAAGEGRVVRALTATRPVVTQLPVGTPTCESEACPRGCRVRGTGRAVGARGGGGGAAGAWGTRDKGRRDSLGVTESSKSRVI